MHPANFPTLGFMAVTAFGCCFAGSGFAQSAAGYPNRAITLVVNSAVGGPTDAAARAIKDQMSAILGQPIVIDNRPAAGGNVGAGQVAKAEPNGYTIMMSGTGPITIAPLLIKNIGYDAERDLLPIALAVTLPTLLLASNSTGAKTLQEFVEMAKRKPGYYTYASVGNGTPSHLATEMLKLQTGMDLLHVPYKGSPQAQTAIMANEVSLYISTLSSIEHVRGGRLRALAQTGPVRAKMVPDVPTVKESGFPEYVFTAWFGLFAPAGTPAAIAEPLAAAALKALADSQAQQVILRFFGVDATPLGAAEFARFLREDRERWAKVIREGGIKAD